MADDDRIKVVVESPRWTAEALTRWKAPADHVGESLADRIAFLAVEGADHVIVGENNQAHADIWNEIERRRTVQ
jgi:hypothetical protein